MRRSYIALTAATAGVLVVSACGGNSSNGSSGSGSTGGTIVIGATLSLTGSLSALGAPVKAGYEQEIADVNAAGGVRVDGKDDKLKLIVLDNASNPSTASDQARELVRQDHAVALLGFTTQQIVTPTAIEAEQLQIPLVTSLMPVEAFASANKDGWKYSWDFFFDEKQQAATVAKALTGVQSNKKVVLFTDNEPDNVVERPFYEAAFRAAGLDVVGDYVFPAGTTNYSSFLASARAKGAQLLAGQLTPADGLALWKRVKSSDFHPRAAFLASASDAASWWKSLGTSAQDTLAEGFWSPSEATAAQLARIRPTLGKKYADSPDYPPAAVAYAVAEVLTDAISRAASTAPSKLNAAIGQSHVQTTAGLIAFKPSTHTGVTPYYITQWQNGKLVQVQPPVSGITFQQPTAGLG
ncbi:MAG TPA: ABC transporter substrate-binding protein [Streptosporangiaceae bacterium]|nr:ABC transporter substrate-binding protein [Streptosporangiaceae bacterium]